MRPRRTEASLQWTSSYRAGRHRPRNRPERLPIARPLTVRASGTSPLPEGPVPIGSLVFADELPDGVVVADEVGRIVVFNRAAGRLTGLEPAEVIGKFVFDVLPLRDADDRDWWVYADPYHGLPTRTRHPERSLYLADGTEVLVSVGYVRARGARGGTGGRAAPQGGSGGMGPPGKSSGGSGGSSPRANTSQAGHQPARRAAAGTAGTQPRRARLDRRPRAALPADQREGLHRHAAGQVGPIHRRPEARDAGDGERRRRPRDQAHHRTAGRVPDRVGPDGGPPAAGRPARPGQEDHRGPGGGGRRRGPVPARGPRRPAGDLAGRRQDRPDPRQPGGKRRPARRWYRDDRGGTGTSGRRRGSGELDAVAVSVRDQGEGISPEVAPRVFRQFWRGKPRGGSRRGQQAAAPVWACTSSRVWSRHTAARSACGARPAAAPSSDLSCPRGHLPSRAHPRGTRQDTVR